MTPTTFTVIRHERKGVMERVFDAPREILWWILTDPQLIPRWWGPEKYPTTVEVMAVEFGGRWRFISRDEAGNAFAFSGTYLAVEPPAHLGQTFNY